MYKRLLRFYVANSLLFLLSMTAASASSKAVLLTQDSTVTGPQNIYVAPKALRVDNQRTGTTLVCKAPKWEVELYNKRNRTAYRTTPEKFHASFFMEITKVYRENLTDLKWKKEGEEVREGVSMIKLAVHPEGKEGRLNLMSMAVRNSDYWVATSFKLPPKVCNVVARLDSMPQLDMIPIDCVYYGINGQAIKPLQTRSIKNVTVIDPFFDCPKFEPAKSERDVFLDPSAQDAMQDMFGDGGMKH